MIALLLLTATAYELHAGVTPIQQVVNMMSDMVATGKQEKHEEQVRFASFTTWCKGTMDEKQGSISDAADLIEQLAADIQKAQADQLRLKDEIAVLDANTDAWEKDTAAANEDRAAQKADYDTLHADYTSSIDAIARATKTLKAQAHDSAQSLLQEVSRLHRIPASARKTIESFLQKDEPDFLDRSAPEANAYEFASGGVVEMLEQLQGKFKGELNGYEKEEMNSRHAHDMLIQELSDSIAQAKKQREEKAGTKASRAQAEAEAKGDKAAAEAGKAEDENYLGGVKTECDQKSNAYEKRQTLRAEELEAITKAIEIIQSPDVSGAGDKHLPQLVQTSFGLLRSTATAPQARAAAFLAEKAQTYHSKLLSMLAQKAESDPFVKVKKMIKDLIVKLMEEANEEAEHKGWCDTELATNGQTRDSKTANVQELTATVDELSAKIAKLSEAITELSGDIAAMDAAVAEASTERAEESAKNKATIADASAAQTAVASALTVLRDFYAKSADATALVQGPAEDAPETFDDAYQGQGAASGGVIGMLEVIESDFARLETDTTSGEATSAEEHQSFLDETSKNKAVKNMDRDNKSKDRTVAEGDLQTTKKDLTDTQAELDAALGYYEKLKPSCVDAGVSYEERVARRKEEIESLQEALKILNGESLA